MEPVPVELDSLNEDFLNAIKLEFRGKNKTDLIRADIRNVLFCGATRSGKTNCFKILQDPCYCPDKTSIFSETRDTNFKSFSLKDCTTGDVHSFILSLIDSPGAFEIQASEEDFKRRNNDEIGKLIIECLKHEIAYLNLVILFLPIQVAVNERNVDAIDLFINMFKHKKPSTLNNILLNEKIKEIDEKIRNIKYDTSEDFLLVEKLKIEKDDYENQKKLPMLLCLTFADQSNRLSREGYVDQIKKHPRLKKYFDDNSITVVFMGCADHKFRNFGSNDLYKNTLDFVVYWRNTFLKHIFDASDRVDLKNTCIYQQRKEDVGELLKLCCNSLTKLQKMDPDTSSYKFEIEGHKVNMNLLYQHKMIIDNVPEYANDTGLLWDNVQTVRKSNLTEERKHDLLNPWSSKPLGL